MSTNNRKILKEEEEQAADKNVKITVGDALKYSWEFSKWETERILYTVYRGEVYPQFPVTTYVAKHPIKGSDMRLSIIVFPSRGAWIELSWGGDTDFVHGYKDSYYGLIKLFKKLVKQKKIIMMMNKKQFVF